MTHLLRNFVVYGSGIEAKICCLLLHSFFKQKIQDKEVSLVLLKNRPSLSRSFLYNFSPEGRGILRSLDIKEEDFLRETHACLKLGQRFCFAKSSSQTPSSFFIPYLDKELAKSYPFLLRHWLQEALSKNLSFAFDEFFSPQSILIERNKSPKLPKSADYEGVCDYAYNFDPLRLDRALEKKLDALGVKSISETPRSFCLSPEANITSLQLQGGESIACDFIFDCSETPSNLFDRFYPEYFIAPKTRAVLATQIYTPDLQRIPLYSDCRFLENSLLIQNPSFKNLNITLLGEGKTEQDLKDLLEHSISEKDMHIHHRQYFTFAHVHSWQQNIVKLGSTYLFADPIFSHSLDLLFAQIKLFVELFPRTPNNCQQQQVFNHFSHTLGQDLFDFNELLFSLKPAISNKLSLKSISSSHKNYMDEAFNSYGRAFYQKPSLISPFALDCLLFSSGKLPTQVHPLFNYEQSKSSALALMAHLRGKYENYLPALLSHTNYLYYQQLKKSGSLL